VAKSIADIGSISESKGDCKKALLHHQKALAMLLAVFGQDHPDVAELKYKITEAYYQSWQGRFSLTVVKRKKSAA